MSSLKKLLKKKGYHKIKLSLTATRHLEVRARINGIEGNFLVDTGASSTCVGFEAVNHFKLFAEDSEIRAAGAGATNLLTRVSQKNTLQIDNWEIKGISLVLFDLKHVNEALVTHDAEPVSGIIGADILKKAKAVIDYKSQRLFLK